MELDLLELMKEQMRWARRERRRHPVDEQAFTARFTAVGPNGDIGDLSDIEPLDQLDALTGAEALTKGLAFMQAQALMICTDARGINTEKLCKYLGWERPTEDPDSVERFKKLYTANIEKVNNIPAHLYTRALMIQLKGQSFPMLAMSLEYHAEKGRAIVKPMDQCELDDDTVSGQMMLIGDWWTLPIDPIEFAQADQFAKNYWKAETGKPQ